MRTMADGSVDAVVTDPPAGIGFMGKTWDKPGVLGVSGGKAMPPTMASRNPICRSCRKHLRGKPPRPACGCAAPDLDTTDGVHRERGLFVDFLTPRLAEARRVSKPGSYMLCWALPRTSHWTGTAIEDAGWVIRDRVSHLFGTGFPKAKSCLKPAMEDWWLAWNPAKKVTPLNIDKCRISAPDGVPKFDQHGKTSVKSYRDGLGGSNRTGEIDTALGRWPANVCHDGSPEVMEAFAAFKTHGAGHQRDEPGSDSDTSSDLVYGGGIGAGLKGFRYGDSGSAARFFYCAKASRSDRGDGNFHPTVKSQPLMRWLCRLITPPGGTVLDPFAGSGSTLLAAEAEGFDATGIEQTVEYVGIIEARIASLKASA